MITIECLDIRDVAKAQGMTMLQMLVSLSSIERDLDRRNERVVVTAPKRHVRHLLGEVLVFVPGQVTRNDIRKMEIGRAHV